MIIKNTISIDDYKSILTIFNDYYGQHCSTWINTLIIDTLKEDKLRIRNYHRQNENYKGYHIYFMGPNNNVFPIELQIWDSEVENDNLLSHTQHKQGYLSDTTSYKHF